MRDSANVPDIKVNAKAGHREGRRAVGACARWLRPGLPPGYRALAAVCVLVVSVSEVRAAEARVVEDERVKLLITESVLCQIPADLALFYMAVSPDGKHVALLARRKDKGCWRLSGAVAPE